jgi:hypothetical protein
MVSKKSVALERKPRIVYKTTNGKEYSSEAAAIVEQDRVNAHDRLCEILNHYDSEDIVVDLLKNRDEVVQLMDQLK